jgi:hypothetical protein
MLGTVLVGAHLRLFRLLVAVRLVRLRGHASCFSSCRTCVWTRGIGATGVVSTAHSSVALAVTGQRPIPGIDPKQSVWLLDKADSRP